MPAPADLRLVPPARDGSWSADDPDRPLWNRTTKLIAQFDYHHEDGRYAYTKFKGLRADGQKVFLTGVRPRTFDDLMIERANSHEQFYRFPDLENYIKGKGEEPDLLYGLPELVRHGLERPDEPIFVVEGEKDADTLQARGFTATTCPDGARKWRIEFNRYFENLNVVILPDNDEVGRDHARQVLRHLLPVARSVKLVDLPGLKPRGDVTDYFEAGGTDEQLSALVAAAEAEPEPFDVDDNGRPFRSVENALRAVRRQGATVRYNEFAHRYELTGLAGFGLSSRTSALEDAALTRMRLTAEREWHLSYGKERWYDIVTDEGRRASYHPVCDYLAGLSWDGVPRLDTWLQTYGGAEDTDFTRAVGAITLLAAVRRVRSPGCKFDELLVLESAQGTNKSSALAVLATRDEWFSDNLPLDAESKEVIEQITGSWLVEIAELKGIGGHIDKVKAMLSRSTDKARLSHGRLATERPRQCVFIGTTNDSAYLRDPTGNRRFWPVRVQRFDIDALKRDRDQLWAEAAKREVDGASIRLPEHLWSVAAQEQASREAVDPWADLLSSRLDGHRGKVRTDDLWEALGLGDASRRTQAHNTRLHAAMQALGWQRPTGRKLRFDGSGPKSAWVKGGEPYSEVPRSVVLGIDANGAGERPY